MNKLPPAALDLPPLPRDLDQVCDRFEDAWKKALAGGPLPHLEPFLTGVEGPQRQTLLLELLAVEVQFRRQLGETPSLEEYQRRFPALPAPLLAREITGTLQRSGSDTYSFLEPARGPDEIGWLGAYRILGVLGTGGMGVVFRAEEPLSEARRRLVAVKVMRPDVARQAGNRLRFQREAETAARLQHDHIIPIYRVAEHAGVPFLVMPLLQGETLEARLRRDGRLPVPVAVRLGRQIAKGLQAAHEHPERIVHRDVKPLNVWLKDGTGAVLMDFGLARPRQPDVELSEPGAVLGTPHYMAPEQLNGQEIDERADLYSLGVVLYRMVTGRLPFPGATFSEVVRRQGQGPPEAPAALASAVPAELSRLVLRLLEAERERRPATAAEVAAALRELETEAGPAAETGAWAEPPTLIDPAARPRRGPRLSRRALVLGLGGLLGAGGLAAWWARSRSGSPPAERRDRPRPLKLDLDVTVWKAGQRERRGQPRLWAPNVLPLRPGDAVRFEATVDRPAFLYLVLLQSSGEPVPFFPWRNDDWKDRPKEASLTRLNLPEAADDAIELPKMPSGVVSVVLLALEAPLPASVNPAALFTGLRAQGNRLPEPKLAAWLIDGELDLDTEERKRFGTVVTVYDPVRAVQDLMRQRLVPLGGTSRAVCFGFRGE